MRSAARVFRALADPTRRQILEELKDGQLAAGEIASRFPISGPSISRHLSLLEAADLISVRRDGNRLLYELQSESLISTLNSFLSTVCPTQIVQRKKQAHRRQS
ncbi:MAG: ArsR family transcriptional regulator [Acidobacteria bacterium]|nr:MAG: ArsR family transcriptional regulator [Acidobacteriota bacterium]